MKPGGLELARRPARQVSDCLELRPIGSPHLWPVRWRGKRIYEADVAPDADDKDPLAALRQTVILGIELFRVDYVSRLFERPLLRSEEPAVDRGAQPPYILDENHRRLNMRDGLHELLVEEVALIGEVIPILPLPTRRRAR